MSFQKYDFSVTQQTTESYVIEIKDELQNPRDMTGFDFYLQCRQSPTSESDIFTLSSTGTPATIVLGQTDTNTSVFDQITLLLTHDLTSGLDFDKGVYDLLMYNTARSHVELLMSGTVTLKRVVTRLPAV